MGRYLDMNRYHVASAVEYEGREVITAYAKLLIAREAHHEEGFDPGGASIYHHLFGGADHADADWREAFNYARRTPEYATYLASEMNGSMFDDSWGDVDERSGPSFMASAFANYMADRVLVILAGMMLEQEG